MLVRCGRCRRVLCRAVAAAPSTGQPVVLVDVRPYARYAADPARQGPARRVHLTCHPRCQRAGRRTRYTLRLDRWPTVGPFAASRGQELVLGA